MQTFRQHVDQKAADELIGRECHGFVAYVVFGAVVLPLERHPALIMSDETMIGDGHPMGIARQISEHRFGSGKGLLGVNEPVGFRQRRKVLAEGGDVSEMRQVTEAL